MKLLSVFKFLYTWVLPILQFLKLITPNEPSQSQPFNILDFIKSKINQSGKDYLIQTYHLTEELLKTINVGLEGSYFVHDVLQELFTERPDGSATTYLRELLQEGFDPKKLMLFILAYEVSEGNLSLDSLRDNPEATKALGYKRSFNVYQQVQRTLNQLDCFPE